MSTEAPDNKEDCEGRPLVGRFRKRERAPKVLASGK